MEQYWLDLNLFSEHRVFTRQNKTAEYLYFELCRRLLLPWNRNQHYNFISKLMFSVSANGKTLFD